VSAAVRAAVVESKVEAAIGVEDTVADGRRENNCGEGVTMDPDRYWSSTYFMTSGEVRKADAGRDEPDSTELLVPSLAT